MTDDLEPSRDFSFSISAERVESGKWRMCDGCGDRDEKGTVARLRVGTEEREYCGPCWRAITMAVDGVAVK